MNAELTKIFEELDSTKNAILQRHSEVLEAEAKRDAVIMRANELVGQAHALVDREYVVVKAAAEPAA